MQKNITQLLSKYWKYTLQIINLDDIYIYTQTYISSIHQRSTSNHTTTRHVTPQPFLTRTTTYNQYVIGRNNGQTINIALRRQHA